VDRPETASHRDWRKPEATMRDADLDAERDALLPKNAHWLNRRRA
jgi:hypothetical protein